jgi:hypothetical protein
MICLSMGEQGTFRDVQVRQWCVKLLNKGVVNTVNNEASMSINTVSAQMELSLHWSTLSRKVCSNLILPAHADLEASCACVLYLVM